MSTVPAAQVENRTSLPVHHTSSSTLMKGWELQVERVNVGVKVESESVRGQMHQQKACGQLPKMTGSTGVYIPAVFIHEHDRQLTSYCDTHTRLPTFLSSRASCDCTDEFVMSVNM